MDTTASAWNELRAVLSAEAQVPAVIRALHASAQRHRVDVLSSDFQRQTMGQTGVVQQSVVVPFRASYAQVKAFLFDVLRNNPSLSMDQIAIKREAVAQSNPEIRVKFSIWVVSDGSDLASKQTSGVSE